MSACSSCGAPIRWAVSSGGKPMPVDVEPVDNGNLVLVEEEGPDEMRGQAILRARSPGLFDSGAFRYVSHSVTCPDADNFRKDKK